MKALSRWMLELGNIPSIDEVFADLRSLREGAPQFHYHPLGFVYSKLLTSELTSVRLHIWSHDGRPQQPQWNIHDHVFDFTSIVLVGGLENELFSFDDDIAAECGLFKVAYRGSGSTLTSLGRFGRIQTREKRKVRAGENYSVCAADLHCSTPTAPFTATLVGTRTTRGEAVVVGDREHPKSIEYTREVASQSAAAVIFDRFLRELESLP